MQRFERLIANGRDLSDSTAGRLEKRLEREPDDLETRLLLIGYWGRLRFPMSNESSDTSKARWAEQQRHVCWLIEHHPGIDLPHGWSGVPFVVDGSIAAQWRDAARRHADDDDVAWNAAKVSFLAEPASAIALFHLAKRSKPERAAEVLELCSLHVGLCPPPGDPMRDEMLGMCGVSNGLEAFELAESDDARFTMVWAMRECAKFTSNEGLLALLRAADCEGNLRRDHAAIPSDAKHHASTGRGLVALARGDVGAAERWLRTASEIGDLPHAPSTALADALRDARRS